MGWGAGLKLTDVVANSETVVAVEILCAVQGLDYRHPLQPSEPGRAVVAAIREVVPRLEDDRPIAAEIETVTALVRSGELVAAVEQIVGQLD